MASEVSGNHAEIWGNGSGAPKALTAAFVSTTTFYTTDEVDMTLEVALAGLATTSVILQLEESHNHTATVPDWTIISDLPNAGVLDGSVSSHNYPIMLRPRVAYRLSAKRVGGDGTSTALILGSFRVPLGDSARTANKDYVPPAYDPTNEADDVTVINPVNKYYDGAPVYEAVDIPDGTSYVYVDHDGVRGASFSCVIAGTVTITYEVSNVDDGTSPASIPAADWSDQTSAIWGAASYSATTFQFDDNNRLGKSRFGRWKIATAGGASGDNLKIIMRGID
jgi:hypothetical protein